MSLLRQFAAIREQKEELEIVAGAKCSTTTGYIPPALRLEAKELCPPHFEEIGGPPAKDRRRMDFDVLTGFGSARHQQTHPSCIPIERNGMTCFDDNGLPSYMIDHLIGAWLALRHSRSLP